MSEFHKNKFISIRRELKQLTRRAYNDYIRRVENGVTNDVKQFFNYVKEKRMLGPNAAVFYQNNDIIPTDRIPDAFAKYFKSVYSELPADYVVDNEITVNNIDTLNISCITENDYAKAIKKLKPKRASGSDGIPPYVIKGCAEYLKKPLLHIYNLCIKTSTFPHLWKLSLISPIFKAGEKSNVENYRPIAVLPAPAKVFEQILHSCLWSHLSTFINPSQHGFIPKKSIITNLLTFNNFVLNAFEHGNQIDAVYTDFRKAFDKVDHEILIKKLDNYGFSQDTLKLIISYLKNRRFIVKFNGSYSNEFDAYSGVPQGSNLGPLLFLFFINDLPDIISNSTSLLFADDLKFFREIKSEEDCKLVQDDINAVYNWSILNKLEFNINKCSTISFTRNNSPFVVSYFMDNVILNRVSHVKDLGITYDSKLSYKLHIESAIRSSFRSLGFIFREAKHLTDINCLIKLYNTLVRPKLEYASILWHSQPNTYTSDVEKVQKKFLRFLYFKKYNRPPDYNTVRSLQLCQEFKVNTLSNRRLLALLLFAFKVLNNMINDANILSWFYFNIPPRNMRSSQFLFIPTVRSTYFAPFLVMCRLVNQVSSQNNVNFFESLNTFKHAIHSIFSYDNLVE